MDKKETKNVSIDHSDSIPQEASLSHLGWPTASSHQICREYDEFLRVCDDPFWIVTLNNGTVVYQDEYRPGLDPSAWIRLRNHCRSHKLHPVKMDIRFRSHTEHVFDEPDCDGAYFVKAILASVVRGEGKKQHHHYIAGHIVGDTAHCKKYVVPELLLENEEERDMNNPKYEESVIWKSL